MSFIFKYLLHFLFILLCVCVYPFVLCLKPFGYNIRKFAVDICFKKSVMRELVYCICQFETGNFDSSLYIRANNVCGMGVPIDPKNRKYFVGVGVTSATDGLKAKYISSFSAVYDFFLWFKFRRACLDQFNVVASQSDRNQALLECVQLLPQVKFTSTNAVRYYEGVYPYLKKYKNTYWLTWLLSVVAVPTWFLALRYFFIKARKHLKKGGK